MSLQALNGWLAAFVLFLLLAGLLGLALDRAARAPGLSTALVAILLLGLSWGGVWLWGE